MPPFCELLCQPRRADLLCTTSTPRALHSGAFAHLIRIRRFRVPFLLRTWGTPSRAILRDTASKPPSWMLTYGKYVTEIRDAQKGRKVRPSLRLVVGLNRAADCVTARASNECVGGRMRADFAVSASVGIAAGGLTLILACGSQAVRSPALVHSMHHNAERCRLSFHMPHILWASPRWRHTKKDTRRCLSPLWWEDMMNSQLIVQTQ